MDISDKNFKPCPCGYQICQFCYNNIRLNPELNGRCPGCRRLYDDESVEYKTISPEEYKLQQLKKEKREREKKQREKEKKEMETANKKHLAGLRVVQKNLVYVTGLNPPCPSDDLHTVLRSDKYFGQYGKITKIVINRKSPSSAPSNPPSGHHSNPGLVVYVTFLKKEDALKCIQDLDGSLCDGRILRAAHGTTKYCSSYLRGHPCPNPNCMFLHEPGEEADSYTRKDLSTQSGIKMSMMGMNNNRSSSNVNFTGGHHFGTSDDDHQSDNAESSAVSTPVATVPTTVPQPMNINNVPPASVAPLPATAHWANDGSTSSASASPSVANNATLTNTAAFPTLGEIVREQKLQQKKDGTKQKTKGKGMKDAALNPDDIDIDDDAAQQFIEETTDYLKALADSKEKLRVTFTTSVARSDGRKILPLFSFNPSATYTNEFTLGDEKLVSRQVVERFLLKPLKNYDLAYQNHPFMQQFNVLQSQLQQQQLQAQQLTQRQQNQSIDSLSIAPGNQEGTFSSDQQKRLLEVLGRGQAQRFSGTGSLDPSALDSGTLNQQQGNDQPTPQQLMALLQLQQLQQQSQPQVNMLRLNERVNTSTPPPPGLFAPKNNLDNQQMLLQIQSQLQHQQQAFATTASASAMAAPSSSSQLLTQLMSGKR